MRKSGGGRIVNISSVAAVTHIPFQTYYSASKAAIESYTCALDNELKPFNISVAAIPCFTPQRKIKKLSFLENSMLCQFVKKKISI